MRSALLAALTAVGVAGPAASQDQAVTSGLPPITVRPSGIEEDGASARARQEKLSRRLLQSEFLFRHICTHCVGGAAAGAPFRPIDTLQASRERDREAAPPPPSSADETPSD